MNIKLIAFLLLLSTQVFSQTVKVPLKKRAEEAAKKYIIATYTDDKIGLDEFEMVKLDTLTEHKNARIKAAELNRRKDIVWKQAESEGKVYRLLKEKTELVRSVYGDGDIMTKMAASEQQESMGKVEAFVSVHTDLGIEADSISRLVDLRLLDSKTLIGYIVFARVVFVNRESGAIANEGEIMVRMNKALRIIE